MQKNNFKIDSEISFQPLQDDDSKEDHHTIIDVEYPGKIMNIFPFKSKEFFKERHRTLNKISLDDYEPNPRQIDFMLYYGYRSLPIDRFTANLKQLKSLKRLNIELGWLLKRQKGLFQLAESLKHLKNLSVVNFYLEDCDQRYFLSFSSGTRSQVFRKIPLPSKAEIQLSLSVPSIILAQIFRELLGVLSHFGPLTLVNLNIIDEFVSPSEIQGIIGSLNNFRSVSKLNVKIPARFFSLPEKALEIFKEAKAIKDLRIHFVDLFYLNLENLVPKVKQLVQLFNLQITFEMSTPQGEVPAFQWRDFLKAIEKSKPPHVFRAYYQGTLMPFDKKALIIILILFTLGIFVVIFGVFLGITTARK